MCVIVSFIIVGISRGKSKREREKEIATARAIIEEYRQRNGEQTYDFWSEVTLPVVDPTLTTALTHLHYFFEWLKKFLVVLTTVKPLLS